MFEKVPHDLFTIVEKNAKYEDFRKTSNRSSFEGRRKIYIKFWGLFNNTKIREIPNLKPNIHGSLIFNNVFNYKKTL